MDNEKQNKGTKKDFLAIYLHGFKSSGSSPKTELLKSEYENFISPSLPISPFLAAHTIEQLIENFKEFYQQIILIGSSLGGFYTLYFLNRYPDLVKAILINPSVHCHRALAKYTGYHTDYRNFTFEWNDSHVEELEQLQVLSVKEDLQRSKILLLIQRGDNVVDYNETLKFLPHAQLDIEDGGTHQYSNLEKKFELMREFIQKV